jgi:folate-dependent phosphoribosylglycinamide formyltransferase PurN
MPENFVILTGFRKSLAATLLIHRLHALPTTTVSLRAVICVSELSLGRLRQLRKTYGSRFMSKAFSAVGMSGPKTAAFDQERATFEQALQDAGIASRSVSQACRSTGTPMWVVKDINAASTVARIKDSKLDYAIYAGGGILRPALISAFTHGVLNMHSAPLPHIRGMNGVEWSLYFGIMPTCTVHYIDPGIDTGRILRYVTVPPSTGDSVASLRAKTVVAGIELLTETIGSGQHHIDNTHQNPGSAGQQYFAMSDRIKQKVVKWLDDGVTPTVDPASVTPSDLRPAPARLLRTRSS